MSIVNDKVRLEDDHPHIRRRNEISLNLQDLTSMDNVVKHRLQTSKSLLFLFGQAMASLLYR